MERFPRLGGLLLVVLGLIGSKFFLFDVVELAKSGANSVSLSMKAVVVSLALVQLGGLMLLLGPSYHGLIQVPGTQKLTPLGWVATLAILAVSFAGNYLLESHLSGLGYKF